MRPSNAVGQVFRLAFFVTLALAATASPRAFSQEEGAATTPPQPAPERERMVYHVKHVPAADLARLLQQVFQAETSVAAMRGIPDTSALPLFTPDPIGQNIVISVPGGRAEPVLDLLESLDRPQPMLRLQFVLAEARGEGPPDAAARELNARSRHGLLPEVMERLKAGEDLHVLASTAIHVVDSQKATVQLGGQMPRVTGVSMGPRGGVNQVSFENTGLLISVSPRVCTPQMITMDVQLEQSRPQPESQGTPLADPQSGPAPRVSGIGTIQLQTTVQVPVPGTLLLGGLWDRDEHGWRELLILIESALVEFNQP